MNVEISARSIPSTKPCYSQASLLHLTPAIPQFPPNQANATPSMLFHPPNKNLTAYTISSSYSSTNVIATQPLRQSQAQSTIKTRCNSTYLNHAPHSPYSQKQGRGQYASPSLTAPSSLIGKSAPMFLCCVHSSPDAGIRHGMWCLYYLAWVFTVIDSLQWAGVVLQGGEVGWS